MENNYDEYYLFRRPAKFADKYIQFWHKQLFEIANKHIKGFKEKSLLEVGIGFGYFYNVCKSEGLTNYTGLDMNQRIVDQLKNEGIIATCAYIPPFPDINNKVDVIWMSQVLEHATDYLNAREMLVSAYDKLSADGNIVVVVPDFLSWGKYFYDIDWSHGFPLTLNRLNQLLMDAGFEIVLSKYYEATSTNALISTSLYFISKLMPVKLFDWISLKLFNKKFCSSFMSLFGWRHIIAIGKKT